jgi:predicted DNA repair protein MutK
MVGGAYLCFEGAEKVWEKVSGHGGHTTPVAALPGDQQEAAMVSGAIRTDFILSAEIMVIALNEVSSEPFVSRLVILVVVALAITALVYGVVALIVKMDDVGLRLAERPGGPAPAVGRSLVRAMPKLLALLSTVGIAAMLWVGGHILLVGFDDLGWHALYDLVHHAEEAVADALAGIGSVASWMVNTAASALLGLLVGAALVAVMHVLPRRTGAH